MSTRQAVLEVILDFRILDFRMSAVWPDDFSVDNNRHAR